MAQRSRPGAQAAPAGPGEVTAVHLDAGNFVDRDVIIRIRPERHAVHRDRHAAPATPRITRGHTPLRNATSDDPLLGQQLADLLWAPPLDVLARIEPREPAVQFAALVEPREVTPRVGKTRLHNDGG